MMSPPKTTAATQLRAWLVAHAMSYRMLSLELGCNQQNIYMWITRGTMPSLTMAVRIELVTGIPPRAWLDQAGEATVTS